MSDQYTRQLQRENSKLRSAVRTLVDEDEPWEPVEEDQFEFAAEDPDDDIEDDDQTEDEDE